MPFRMLLAVLAVGLAQMAHPALAEERTGCAVEALDGRDANLWIQGSWRPLEVGLAIPRDSIVMTGEETRARIACADGLQLTVGVATEINLETVASRRGGRVAQLIKGVLGVLSPRRMRQEFEIRTPAATASVSSAEALVEFSPDKGAAVFVRRGETSVVSLDGRLAKLREGEGVAVDPTGQSGPVKVWGAARIKQATDALGFDWR